MDFTHRSQIGVKIRVIRNFYNAHFVNDWFGWGGRIVAFKVISCNHRQPMTISKRRSYQPETDYV